MSIKQLAGKLNEGFWALGFVTNGLDGVMNDEPVHVQWLKMPKDGWFADPFILDVIHGYNGGTVIKELIYNDLKSPKIVGHRSPQWNPGETLLQIA